MFIKKTKLAWCQMYLFFIDEMDDFAESAWERDLSLSIIYHINASWSRGHVETKIIKYLFFLNNPLRIQSPEMGFCWKKKSEKPDVVPVFFKFGEVNSRSMSKIRFFSRTVIGRVSPDILNHKHDECLANACAASIRSVSNSQIPLRQSLFAQYHLWRITS